MKIFYNGHDVSVVLLYRIYFIYSGEDIKFGCTSLRVPAHVLCKLKNHINVSPNGVAFVKQHVRKGVISRCVLGNAALGNAALGNAALCYFTVLVQYEMYSLL